MNNKYNEKPQLKKWQVNKNEYQQKYKEMKLIKNGKSGQTKIVKCIQDQKYYISKKIQLLNMNDKQKQHALLELSQMIQFKHPNIIDVIDVFKINDQLIIIMEYIQQGDLKIQISKIKKKGEYFQEKTILNWFIQILMAVHYIHQKTIIHKNIKVGNIFLTEVGSVKLGRLSITAKNQKDKDLETIFCQAPELITNLSISEKSDIWSLGCALYELCQREHVFKATDYQKLCQQIKNDEISDITSNYSHNLNQLIKQLLQKNPDNRPFALLLFQDQYIIKSMTEFYSESSLKQSTLKQQQMNQIKQSECDNTSVQDETQSAPEFQSYDSASTQLTNEEQKIENKMKNLKEQVKKQYKELKQQKTNEDISRDINDLYISNLQLITSSNSIQQSNSLFQIYTQSQEMEQQMQQVSTEIISESIVTDIDNIQNSGSIYQSQIQESIDLSKCLSEQQYKQIQNIEIKDTSFQDQDLDGECSFNISKSIFNKSFGIGSNLSKTISTKNLLFQQTVIQQKKENIEDDDENMQSIKKDEIEDSNDPKSQQIKKKHQVTDEIEEREDFDDEDFVEDKEYMEAFKKQNDEKIKEAINQLDDVLNIYKYQLQHSTIIDKKFLNLSEISEHSNEGNTLGQSTIKDLNLQMSKQ